MNKIALIFLLCFGAIAFCSGCVVQSLNPFYTKETLIDMPQVHGKWLLIKDAGSDVSENNIKPWIFSKDKIQTLDENEVGSILDVNYFMIEDAIFVNITAGEVDKSKINSWWLLHVILIHTVCKVNLGEYYLILTPLNYGWIRDTLEEKNISLPFINLEDEDHIIFTTNSERWVSFLKEYKNDKDAFPDDYQYVLERY